MDISVIIPIYGVERYIERFLHSLFTQTKTDGVEFILVNDCTQDESITIAKRVIANYPEIVVHLLHQVTNQGVAAARQCGLRQAIGGYILFADPDDFCSSMLLEQFYRKAQLTGADIVYSDFEFLKGERLRYVKQVKVDSPEDFILGMLRGKLHGALWNKMFKQSLIKQHQLQFTAGVNYMEDFLFVIRLLLHTESVAYLPESHMHYIYHTNSLVSGHARDKLLSVENLIGHLEELLGTTPSLHEALVYRKAVLKLFMMRMAGPIDLERCSLKYGKLSHAEGLDARQRWQLRLAELHLHHVLKWMIKIETKLRKTRI